MNASSSSRRLARYLAVPALLMSCGALAAPKVHTVFIEGMKFSPAALEVSRGDTVVWTNKDMFPHNATAESGAFRSGDIASGQSWTYRAGEKGSFPYFCSLHPTMKASLTVK